MKTLLVLRHGKASPDDGNGPDHERSLLKKGRKAAKAIGRVLSEHQLVPDLVLSSTAARARSTAEATAEAAGYTGEIVLLDELYLAEPVAYLDALKRRAGSAERVLVVGHNPGIEALIFRLTGETAHMPTAALADCALPIGAWTELGPETQGKLEKVYRPKELED